MSTSLQVSSDPKEAAIHKNKELYWIDRWGKNYFQVNEKGEIVVFPERNGKSINLFDATSSLVQKGVKLPILFRFDGIIRDRVTQICTAFEKAIQEASYKGSYQPVFPIKVNPQKQIVDTIRKAGAAWKIGLEVGSKPELLASLTTPFNQDHLVLCNGYKDAEYIELALSAAKLGKKMIIIIEQFYELELVLKIAQKLDVEPEIGFRMKLHTRGSGKWASSGGDQAKFGLTAPEIIQGLEILKNKKKENCLKLLHFHIGSQITSIRSFDKALSESTRMYSEISKFAPSLSYIDVGGGLAVDYEGAATNSDFSANYTLELYAKKIVSRIAKACDKNNLPHPVIISESGRAMVAHHSILVMEIVSASSRETPLAIVPPPPHFHPLHNDLFHLSQKNAERKEWLESAKDLKGRIIDSFIDGELGLLERATADAIHKQIIAKAIKENEKDEPIDLYFGNFSLFQSLPDIWAIQQIFPLLPIHRLEEQTNRRATIVDLTCDSDGKIDRFVTDGIRSRSIPVHELDPAKPYYIGAFLVGAYQEILGNRHNLFGNTHVVHFDFDGDKEKIVHELPSSTNLDMLTSVQFDKKDYHRSIDKAIAKSSLTSEETSQMKTIFESALHRNTYLGIHYENE